MANELQQQTPNMICVGVIAGAHGVRGAVRFKIFTQDPLAILAYKELKNISGTTRFEVINASVHKGDTIIASFANIKDRNQAEALKSTKLYIDREKLPTLNDEEFYHADLVGLAVKIFESPLTGEVRAVHNFGAGDLLEIGCKGHDIVVPLTKEVVPEINLKQGYLLIKPEGAIADDDFAKLGVRDD